MKNFFAGLVVRKNKNRINPLIRELIEFTNHQDPESMVVMEVLPELKNYEPTEEDLDALESAFMKRHQWAPLNKEFWEEIIADILKEHGRKID